MHVAKHKKRDRGESRRGRRPILRDRVGLTVQFDGTVYERLPKLSEKREKSIGSLVRDAVEAYLRRQKGR